MTKHYDMTVAWRLHIGALVLLGLGWTGALIYTLSGAEGPGWWFFAIGLSVFAFLLTVFLRSLAREVRIAGDAVTVATAFGTRHIPLSDLDRPGRFESFTTPGSWIRTVRYDGGRFLVPGNSSGGELLRDLRSAAAAE